jgi:hypothetical protein
MVALEGVPPSIAEAIEYLAEPHTESQLAQRIPTLDADWIAWLCAHLSSSGILTDTPRPPPPEVFIYGQGALARRLSTAIDQAGVSVGGLPEEFLGQHHNDRLVILAERQVEPDRALTAKLTGFGIPHLVVRIEPSRAVVGPLVVPGRTACVRCDDLAHCVLDCQWPTVLAQLCAASVSPDPGLLGWAVATASAQVRAWVGGTQPEALGRCLELGLDDFRLRTRSWPRQPDCTCLRPGAEAHAGR